MRRISAIGSKPLNHAKSGFTLLEILAVLLLITVAIGLVLPNLEESTRGMELKIISRQIERDIEQLRKEAEGTGTEGKLVFTPGSKQYQLLIGRQVFDRPLNGLIFAGEEPVELSFGRADKTGGVDKIPLRNSAGTEFFIPLSAGKGVNSAEE